MLKNTHLLSALPDEITLLGIAIHRAVYLNGELLDFSESKELTDYGATNFDWGYRGSGPAQLALGILYKCSDHSEESNDLILLLAEAFKITFVAQLSAIPDFHVKIKLKQFIKALAGMYEKPLAASELIEHLPIDQTVIKVSGYRSLALNSSVMIAAAKPDQDGE